MIKNQTRKLGSLEVEFQPNYDSVLGFSLLIVLTLIFWGVFAWQREGIYFALWAIICAASPLGILAATWYYPTQTEMVLSRKHQFLSKTTSNLWNKNVVIVSYQYQDIEQILVKENNDELALYMIDKKGKSVVIASKNYYANPLKHNVGQKPKDTEQLNALIDEIKGFLN